VRIVVLMGVTGAGKTTVGQQLAVALGWTFVEGDAFHPPANIAKMHRGEPLDDADRAPWLRAIRQRIDELVASAQSAVIACSALKEAYREVLARDRPEVTFVYLKASAALIAERLRHRAGHFMPPALLQSQLDTLEEAVDGITVDAGPPPTTIVAAIRRRLSG
jgi:carbohydrate kinase (thermoresistant glucokinase family)